MSKATDGLLVIIERQAQQIEELKGENNVLKIAYYNVSDRIAELADEMTCTACGEAIEKGRRRTWRTWYERDHRVAYLRRITSRHCHRTAVAD